MEFPMPKVLIADNSRRRHRIFQERGVDFDKQPGMSKKNSSPASASMTAWPSAPPPR